MRVYSICKNGVRIDIPQPIAKAMLEKGGPGSGRKPEGGTQGGWWSYDIKSKAGKLRQRRVADRMYSGGSKMPGRPPKGANVGDKPYVSRGMGRLVGRPPK